MARVYGKCATAASHSREPRLNSHELPTSNTTATVTHTLSLALPVSFRAVSRPLELSLQSTLQLSITVLVCYRFHGHI